MSDPFVHLHVASGYSLQYGASHPHVLVERAAEQEMDALALTDRDGTYGAVRFAKAAMAMGVRPILGVDLAFSSSVTSAQRLANYGPDGGSAGIGQPLRGSGARTPARGGASRDARLPRVTFLASGRSGWAAVCRLVSATHAAGERGTPVCMPELVAEHVTGRDVRVLLGPASELGHAATLRRDDLGREVLGRWLDLGHAVAVLWLLLVLLAALLLQIRNIYGFFVVVVVGVALFVVSWRLDVQKQVAVAYLVTWFLLLAAPRPVWELQAARRRGRVRSSDADQLGRLTPLPAIAWVGLFLLVTLGSLVVGASMLVG